MDKTEDVEYLGFIHYFLFFLKITLTLIEANKIRRDSLLVLFHFTSILVLSRVVGHSLLGITSSFFNIVLFFGLIGNLATIFATHVSSKRMRQMAKTKATSPIIRKKIA